MADERKSVLFLFKWNKIREVIENVVKTYNYPYTYYYISTVHNDERTLGDIMVECSTLVDVANIQCVVSTDDFSSLVHAALKEKYPHILGASFESEFLAMHKLFTRSVIGSKVAGANVEFGSWDRIPPGNMQKQDNTDLSQWLNMDVDKISGHMDCSALVGVNKVIAKPYLSTCSEGIVVLRKKEELAEFLQTESEKDPKKYHIPTATRNFIQEFLPSYDLNPGLIIEEFLDITADNLTFHSYDTVVQNKEFIPWVLCDSVYWSHRPQCFQALLLPSAMPQTTQKKINETMKHLANVLITYGYDNQFLNAEFIVRNGETVRLMEINGRMANQIGTFCAQVLDNGDFFKAAIQIGMGIPVPRIAPTPNKFGLNAYLNVFQSGRCGDIVDYAKAKEFPEVRMYFPEDSQLVFNGDPSGKNMGYVDVVATSYEECVARVRDIVSQIYLKPEVSAWLENTDMITEIIAS